MQEQQRKTEKVPTEKAPLAVDDKEAKAEGGGDQKIDGAESVDSPENVEREPGHEASTYGRRYATGEGDIPSAPAEEE